jgi:predicted amidohydrolase YtcJ
MECLARLDWPPGTRHRLEHVQVLPRQALAPGSLDGLVLSVQPSHMWDDRSIAETHLEAELAHRLAYPFRTMLDSGGLLVFGSDAPVEGVDPWRGICAAVTRLAVDGAPPWIAGERLTLSEALQAHTAAPALLHGQAFAGGVLAPGRLADLVVLAGDPFEMEPAELRRGVPVDLTLVDGEPVHRRA